MPSLDSVVIARDEYGEWTGIYVNGKLRDEGDDLALERVLEMLGIYVTTLEVDGEWLADCGSLPDSLENVRTTD